MFFVVSKILWFIAAPVNALLFLLAIAVGLSVTGYRRGAARLAGFATVCLLIIGFLPVGAFLLLPLESRFPQPPADMPPPAGIIVLGGSTDEVISDARDQVTVVDAATRITAGVELARRFPKARLVFSGGSAALLLKRRTEAEDTARLWIGLGVQPDRITVEDRSRNTYENAVFTHDLIKPKPGEAWLLVTSAYHMPRAVGLFRAVGFPVTPYPVDYHTSGTWTDWLIARDASAGFKRVDTALREWVGLAAYRLTGKIDVLFPGPESATSP